MGACNHEPVGTDRDEETIVNPVAFGSEYRGCLHILYLFGADGTLYIVTTEHKLEGLAQLQELREKTYMPPSFLNDMSMAIEKHAMLSCIHHHSYGKWLAGLNLQLV